MSSEKREKRLLNISFAGTCGSTVYIGEATLTGCVQAARISELETENAALRERVAQLDERTNTLSKEIVRAKFRGQQQVTNRTSWCRV